MALIDNHIYISSVSSPLFHFSNASLETLEGESSFAIANESLSYDIFSPVVICSDRTIEDIKYGTPLFYYVGSNLIGKYYIKNVERTTKYLYKLNCISGIGLLSRMKDYGGIYDGGKTFEEVLDTLLNKKYDTTEKVFNYQIEGNLKYIPIKGYLPYGTKRDNLYQLLLAANANIVTDENGDYVFKLFNKVSNSTLIIPDYIFDEGSVKYQSVPSKITITKHSYMMLGDTEEQVIFDNTGDVIPVVEKTIEFSSAPIQLSSIKVTGLTVSFKNENVAIVTGIGTIKGKPYTHTEDTLEETDDTAYEDKTISVSDCTLINEMNAEVISERLFSYYKHAKTVSNSIRLTNEHCSGKYMFTDPFGDNRNGFLTKMTLTAQSFVKASCEYIIDWEPANYNYQNPWKDKKVSILGDDFCTYAGYVPEGTGYGTYYTGENCGVSSVNQTWWMQLITRIEAVLCKNNSISEAYCSNHHTEKIPACDERRTNGLKSDSDEVPDIIIVYVGMNDYNNGVTFGEYDGSGEVPTDTSKFRESYGYTLGQLVKNYPKAKLYCCTMHFANPNSGSKIEEDKNKNDELKTDWNTAIRNIANHFKAEIIDFEICGITLDNIKTYCGDTTSSREGLHPNSEGHKLMYDEAIKHFI